MKIGYFLKIALLIYLVGLFHVGHGLAQSLNSPKLKQQQKNVLKSFGGENGQRTFTEELPETLPIPLTGPGQISSVYYSIHVLGEVTRPGTYRILPSDRLTDALNYAGGVKDNASLRRIQLRRKNKTKIIDIFSYRTKGLLSQNPYLMENDVVFIPLKKGEIQVEGPVKRPGKYELSGRTSLKRAISMAGGFAKGRSLKEPIRVIRYNKDEQKEILKIKHDKKALAKFRVQKGDIILVPHVLTTKSKFDYNIQRIPGDNIFYPSLNDDVYVVGAVFNPGPYPFLPNYNYKDYVSQAGPHMDAKIRYVRLMRRDDNKKNRRLKDKDLIHPGDILFVPHRRWRPETIVSFIGSAASAIATSIIVYDRLN